MIFENFGKIVKITGENVLIKVLNIAFINDVRIKDFSVSYVSIGSLIGTKLLDGRILLLLVYEITENESGIYISAFISGIFDQITHSFTFGANKFPLVGESTFYLENDILVHIFNPSDKFVLPIGTYHYDNSVLVSCNPNVLFGKHLGIFGNTGSGKTCTIVSIIQKFISSYPNKDIKFIILDVNGEYKSAFSENTAEFVSFKKLRFHHSILSKHEYGKLCRASEGIQYPALKDCIDTLNNNSIRWNLLDLSKQLTQWIDDKTLIDKNGRKDYFSKNQLLSYLRSMELRIESIFDDNDLMEVINSADDTDTIDLILHTTKKVIILDLQVSNDCLDIVVFLLFKSIYVCRSSMNTLSHFTLVLEEAHRYINYNAEESKLGNYYIDKLAREGRKFGIGLIISSQIPSMLQYEVVSQCNSVIMHKISNKRDLEFLRSVLRVSNEMLFVQMSALEKQHAIVCGEAFPLDAPIRVINASPLPRSADPEIQNLEMSLIKSDKHDFINNTNPEILNYDKYLVSNFQNSKDEIISQLQCSTSFSSTHALISQLSKYDNWSLKQYIGLCDALMNNSQVNLIRDDDDVNKFFRKNLYSINKILKSLISHYGVTISLISSACDLIFGNLDDDN